MRLLRFGQDKIEQYSRKDNIFSIFLREEMVMGKKTPYKK